MDGIYTRAGTYYRATHIRKDKFGVTFTDVSNADLPGAEPCTRFIPWQNVDNIEENWATGDNAVPIQRSA